MKVIENCQIAYVDAKNAAGKPLTLESFLTAKLGVSAGRRLYKELVTAAKDATSSCPGAAAIDLNSKSGEFISVQELN
jgi:hypothetical protein